ncbi:oleate hydratase [Undibacterium jejuense]|uniref:Oleate hydratase n=1 Tax=Undibacterium jejuense TaxID=1344949 RepID=A0A923HEU4_9BURK|nr:oleate hydratase [Undibacterium jejuense]MBC3863242.1 oleate hydratase [Undibacterium jejuense]
MTSTRKAYFVGGGIGSLAGAAFLIRDGGMAGNQISIFDAASVMGGSLDGCGDAVKGYSMRGGRMLTTDNYECTWNLFKSIPSLTLSGKSIFEETAEFNEKHHSNAMARLVDSRRAKVPVKSMGFSIHDRVELLKLASADEEALGNSRITDHLSPEFFETEFWYMWVTTFAFQPWHSAVEFRRYLHRFLMEFVRIETLAGVKRTVLNQYDSLVVPLQRWLEAQGVHMISNCLVTDLEFKNDGDNIEVLGLRYLLKGQTETLQLEDGDLTFLQNGSMTDASSLGSMTAAPAKLKKTQSGSWSLWEKIAEGRPMLGNPKAFNSCVAQSDWASFTVTLKDSAFFDQMHNFSGNEAGTGGLVTFKDSNWLMSIVLAHQPHFANQPSDVFVFWGYGLFPDRIGNFIPKAMADCTGEEILQELCGHLRFDFDTVLTANCIPCRMPYITSMFMPRAQGDRPLPIPPGTKNFAFISQFVEIPLDTVFTVEFSVRAAQMAVYELLGITTPIPPVTPHDKSLHTQFEALIKAL